MKLAIVTGGSRGLGQELCLQLQALGYQVVEFSRSAPHPFSCRLDLASPIRAAEIASASLAQFKPESLSELLYFNNAATLAPIGFTWKHERLATVENIQTNITGQILLISEVIRHFRSAPGEKKIVNISSGAALKGYAGWTLYCAAKAGLEGFIRSLAAEEAHQSHPFTALTVDPGVMDTEMQSLIRRSSPQDFPDVARFIQRQRDGGLESPAAVASALLELVLSDTVSPGERGSV